MIKQNRTRFGAGVALAMMMTFGVSASEAGEGDAAYRKLVMASVGAHMKSIATIIKGKVAHSGDLTLHANAMRDLSKMAGHVFPKDSEGGNALPILWEKPDDLAAALKAFQSAAGNFAEVAAAGDAGLYGAALGGLGKSCKGCHSQFKK